MTKDTPQSSDENGMLVLVLCLFFGVFGAHRFYVGKTRTALAQLFTLGGLGIWAFVDLLIVAFCEFTDMHGRKINPWEGM